MATRLVAIIPPGEGRARRQQRARGRRRRGRALDHDHAYSVGFVAVNRDRRCRPAEARPRYMPGVLNEKIVVAPRSDDDDSAGCRRARGPRPSTASAAACGAFAADPHPRADFMGDADADEIFAGAGRRDRAGAVVGIGAGADDRRIADPRPSACRSGRRSRSRRRHGRRCRRATAPTVPYFSSRVEMIGRSARMQSSSWRRRSAVANHSGADLLETLLARELVGALAAEEDVRALLHHRAGEADRVAWSR